MSGNAVSTPKNDLALQPKRLDIYLYDTRIETVGRKVVVLNLRHITQRTAFIQPNFPKTSASLLLDQDTYHP